MAEQPPWLAIPEPWEMLPPEPDDPGPCGCTPDGVVYTLHFDPPYVPYEGAPAYKTAGHYTGHAYDLERRLAQHEAGRGAKLTRAQVQTGGSWRVAETRHGDRNLERQLKGHGAARRCPICKAEAQSEPEIEAGA